MAKKPIRKSPPKPRNVAAKSLRAGQFQPKVEDNPKAYTRKVRHKAPLVPPEEEGSQE
jgi:hypothetical protein